MDLDDKKEDKAANEVVDDVLASTLATTKELLGSILMPRNPKQVSALILSDDVIRENVKYYLADDFCKGGGAPQIRQIISAKNSFRLNGPLSKKGLPFLGVIMSQIQPEQQILK